MFNEILLARPGGDWLSFREPVAVVTACQVQDVLPALVEVEGRVNAQGLYAAGFVSFEAAAGLDAALTTRAPGSLPLVCFGLFAEPELTQRPVAAHPAAHVRWQNPTSKSP